MASYYSILKYVPDAVAGESVNIGVVVANEEMAICRIASNLGRAARFGGVKAQELRSLVSQFEEATGLFFEHEDGTRKLTFETLTDISINWQNSLQVTEPRGSVRPLSELLDTICARFLITHEQRPSVHGASKSAAVSKGREALKRAVVGRNLDATYKIVGRGDAVVPGERVSHHFDYGVKNGVLKIGGFGLSLDLAEEEEILRQMDLIALVAIDVRARNKQIPMSVVVVSETGRRKDLLTRADQLLGPSHVDVLRSEQAEEWAEDQVERLAIAA